MLRRLRRLTETEECAESLAQLAEGSERVYDFSMVKRRNINAFVKRVVAEFHPQRVILFGSYAYGKPTAASDVDLLVVMPHEGPASVQAAEIRKHVRAGFPMDLVVRSPTEVKRRLAMGDYFIQDIFNQGKTLYEADYARVG